MLAYLLADHSCFLERGMNERLPAVLESPRQPTAADMMLWAFGIYIFD